MSRPLVVSIAHWLSAIALRREERFYARDPEGYERIVHGLERRRDVARLYAQLARAHFEQREVGLIVDLACGTGLFSEQLSCLGRQLIGVDLSAPMLTHAAAKDLPNARFQRADLHDLSFVDDGSADLVTMYAASRFISNPTRFFGELARVLSSDGLVIISYFDSPRRVPEFKTSALAAGLRELGQTEIPPSFLKRLWPLIRFNETTIRTLVAA